ncbi:MAG: YraN family protein [Verrucomicrobiota bacterium]
MLARFFQLFRGAAPTRASVGAKGEAEAERFLKKQGFRVQERNWRKGRDEIDLIGWVNEVLVFVEVRTRKKGALVGGYDSIGPKKKKALLRCCRGYLYGLKKKPRTHRFDVVEVEHEEGRVLELRHFENVPLFSKATNRGR